MKNKRKNRLGIVWRGTINDRVRTLWGGFTVEYKQCSCCKVVKPLTEFYLSSSGTESYGVRNQCIECWDQYNGKTPKRESTSSLEEFLNGIVPNMNVEKILKRADRKTPKRESTSSLEEFLYGLPTNNI